MKLQEKINSLNENEIHDFYVWLQNNESWQETSSLSQEELNTDNEYSIVQVELLLSDSRGIYIPQYFFRNFGQLDGWNVDLSNDEKSILNAINSNDFNSNEYWEIWQYILDNAYCVKNGKKWELYQDGDLFAIHYL